MILTMMMNKEEIKKVIKFFEILHQINCRIQLNNPLSSRKEADEDLDQDEPTNIHRDKRNCQLS
jgi:hypothetical protein